MHGERDGRTLSSPPPSMLTDETTRNDTNSTASSSHNPPTELAYLPIGCSVSAKYRGAFCSAQVKAIEKQVKLKVTLFDSGDTITVSEEQLVHSVPLRIGNTVTVRLPLSNRRQSNDSNSHHHYSRTGLAAFINPTNPDEKQATIKQIIDNSIYTVVFNDGDEKSLRRSSLCLQGVRLYQTQYGQQKILEEIPSSPPPAPLPSSLPSTSETTSTNANDISSIVAIKRQGNSDQQVFPAYILKRKALADYMWVRSFVDGREYIVHTRDDVQAYNNPEIQTLCRSTSKQATQACEKFIKYNQIPAVWQKKKKKQTKSDDKNTSSNAENSSSNESSSSESDDDDDDDDDEIDEETTEEKDSFVAQLFAFMDDRGTPINNIPKVQNYDLDLHRLFKIVRMLGGYNKVTKNDQWDVVHIKMGLPDETSSKNGRSIENAYKKYLFAYEDLSKKLGSMNAPSAYFGGRTSMGSDSRRSLIRVRQQQQQQEEEEKNKKIKNKTKQSPAPVKQRSRKSNESRPSTDSKQTSSTKKTTPKSSSAPPNRKGPNRNKPSNVISSSSSDSESESSDDQSSRSSSSNYKKTKIKTSSSTTITPKKPTTSSSTIPKKTTQVSSTSSSSTNTTKTDIKKISTNTKSISSSTSDNKQSKLTITIPISKPKTQSANSSNIQSIKKPNLSSSTKDEKKKLSDTKTIPIKTESKSIASSSSPSITKKPLISSSKIPQITKGSQQQKQSSNESVKSTSSTVNKPSSSSSILPFKPKTSQSQTSTNNNKDRTGISKPSSSIDSRQIKSTKINSSSTKSISTATPIKKPKPTINEENLTKSLPSTSTMKIPKLSTNNDPTKKSTITLDKIPKKQILKETTGKIPKIQDISSTNKSTIDQPSKPHTSSPTTSESIKKSLLRDVSPLPVTPASPSPPPPPPLSSIPNESIPPTTLSQSLNNIQNVNSQHDTTPDIKPSEISLIPQSTLITTKELNENEILPSNTNKRLHLDENIESIYTSEIDEQLSPSKRARRSISSQESFETFSSEPSSNNDIISTNRNIQLTYEDISINDILLVTWGNHGTKQYPARCIEKNDEKKELFVHYTGWNSRHDEWIKLDRVIECKDSTNTNTLFQQRPRRTSQINTYRQQHLDSTNSNEQLNQQQQQQQQQQQITSSLLVDVSSSSSTLIDSEEHIKHSKSMSNERNKTEESDIDDNSQGQNEIWNHVETISSAEDDALSYSSINRPNQSILTMDISTPTRRRISINNNDNSNIRNEFESIDEDDNENQSIRDDAQIIPKRRQSRATSSNNKVDSISNIKTEQIEEIPSSIIDVLEHPHQYPLHVKEETIDSSSISHQSFQMPSLPPPSSLLIDRLTPSTNILTSPPATATGNRRASVRQQKRRSLREPNNTKDSSGSAKKKTKLDNGNIIHIDNGVDNINTIDQTSTRSNSTDQQSNENMTIKRCRPPGRRGGKKSINQQEYENDDYRSNSPSNITMRQQLKDMFKHRPSRYNFLDLNNNLTGDERITHLKDRMRECQKVFFNLKSALVKIEKQRKGFLRKQKPILTTTPPIIQTTTTEILATSTCT